MATGEMEGSEIGEGACHGNGSVVKEILDQLKVAIVRSTGEECNNEMCSMKNKEISISIADFAWQVKTTRSIHLNFEMLHTHTHGTIHIHIHTTIHICTYTQQFTYVHTYTEQFTYVHTYTEQFTYAFLLLISLIHTHKRCTEMLKWPYSESYINMYVYVHLNQSHELCVSTLTT